MRTQGLAWTRCLCVVGLLACLPARAQDTATPSQPELAWEVYRIFHRHCADCHGGHRNKPKGKFGHVLDLERLSSDQHFVVPGDPAASEIYLLMSDPDPEFRMPPEDSDAGPVGAADLAIVHDWILGGAGTGWKDVEPAAAALSGGTEPESASAPALFSFAGRLHPLVVHFPVALILAALGAELMGLREAARWCLWVGALGAIISAGSGWVAAGTEGYRADAVFLHRWLGVTTTGLALVSAVALERGHRGTTGKRAILLARILLLVTALAVGIVGHTGGELVHGAWGG